MPHGLPDWGLTGPKTTVYGLDDVGEAAVRLGSPVSWDRRGDVVFVDSFNEGGGRPEIYDPWVGATTDLVTDYALHGPLALRFNFDADSRHDMFLEYYHPPQTNAALGLEMSFSMNANVSFVLLGIEQHTETDYWARVYIDCETWQLWYWDLDRVYQPHSAIPPLEQDLHTWHAFKMVMDPVNAEYVRVMIDYLSYDLKGLAIPPNPFPADRRSLWRAGGAPIDVAGGMMEIDRVIGTQNEPV